MSDEVHVLSALGIAAFERREGGAFTPLCKPPAWLSRIIADGTFPFLGHILEEANEFWDGRSPGRRDWGPCAEVDDSGTEFHYIVSGLTVDDKQYLVFQLDPGSDRMRQVLQQIRDKALAAGQDLPSEIVVERAQRHVRETATEIQSLVAALPSVGTANARFEQWKKVSGKCEALVRDVDNFVNAMSPPSRQKP